MIIGNMLQHAFNGVSWCIAFAVISPASSSVSRRIRNAVRQSAAEWFVTIGCTSFVIVGIKMSIGQVKDLQRLSSNTAVGYLLANESRFWNGRQSDFPIVVRVVRDGTHVTDDETTDFVSRENQPRQNKDNFFSHGENNAFANST